jgi:hypothetical protein
MSEEPKKINFEIISDKSSLTIISGMTGLGKSHLIRYLMFQNRKDFDFGIVFCNTHFEDGSFDYVPKGFVHEEYDEEVLINLMETQKDLLSKGISKRVFIIFDDCLDPEQFKSPILKKLPIMGRHYNISCIMSTQYPQLIPSSFRENATNVFMFQSSHKNTLEALYENYAMEFDSFNDFKQYVLTKTGNYKFIYHNKTKNEGSIEKNFRVFKCPQDIPKFQIKYNTKV